MKLLGWLERTLVLLSVVAMIVITAIICYGIIARSLHWPGLPDDILIVRQLMVAAIAASLGFATAERAHIAIDILYNLLPPGLRKACNLLAFAVGLVAFVPLTIWAWDQFASSFASGAYMYGKLQLPEWPEQAMFFFGLFVMVLRLMELLIHDALHPGPVDEAPGGAD